MIGRRVAVPDALAVNGERRFVTGCLDGITDLLVPLPEGVGQAVDLDAELFFEHGLGIGYFLAQPAVHSQSLHVFLDQLKVVLIDGVLVVGIAQVGVRVRV